MAISTPSMQELLEAGVHFGHKVARGNPKMKTYIYGTKDGVHIIDLAKSEELLKTAVKFIYELGEKGGTLLVVGTKKQAQELVKTLSQEANAYYITAHWVGGLLTNFDEIKKNIDKLNTLKKEKSAGELKRYTKKEQLLISRKLEKFELIMGGVAQMNKLPDVMFIVDAVAEDTAIKEATKMAIPLVGFTDTNADPTVFDYPIPANDDGIKSITLICEAVLKAYGEGGKNAKKIAAAKALEAMTNKTEAKVVDGQVAQETAEIEEEIEKKAVEESERKVE